MRQLTFVRPGRFEWQEVRAPALTAATDAIVRPLTVARCDLDLYIARGVVPYPGPFAFGHETIAEVVEVGDAVPFVPGDTVAVPFHRVQARMALPEVLRCLHDGTLRPQHVTHRVVPFAAAIDAMTDAGPKVVFTQDR